MELTEREAAEDKVLEKRINTLRIDVMTGKEARIALRCINEGVSLRAALKLTLADAD